MPLDRIGEGRALVACTTPHRTMSRVLLALAVLSLILIPLVPRRIRFKIGIRRRLNWDWGADRLDKRFDGWVLFGRVLLLVVAAVLLNVGWGTEA
ncbi:MAG: membrane protease YdiL (CAAX protease family) [Chlamydiales bacterium]|jgi:membrane protease YdiL (CAAX protease family)